MNANEKSSRHPSAVIYFRGCEVQDDDELVAAQKHFDVITSRCGVREGELIIARYSALPFYRELEEDLKLQGARLINSYHQHRFIADLGEWVEALGELTPETWRTFTDIPDDAYPLVIKGETNSKKFMWDTHMFAANRVDAGACTARLNEDSMVGDQRIYYRRYVPLRKLMDGFRGLPVSEEYRLFVCHGEVVSKGFYWSNYIDDLPVKVDVNDVPQDFIDECIRRIGNNAVFYALDVARTEDGKWIVIELNDGQMSGLSENDPEVLYANLKRVLLDREP